MYYVYILKDIKNQLYVGYTGNLRARFFDHINKKVFTTKRMEKITLIYYEAYHDQGQAKIREKKLKQYGSSYQGLLKRIGLK